MLGPDEWAQLARDYATATGGTQRVLGAILDMHDRLETLERAFGNLKAREEFKARLEALSAAREHVSALPSEQQNTRGYRDKALHPHDRVAEELRVARYLLGGSD